MLENGFILKADGRQYTIIEQLGRGANTVAYLAECRYDNFVTKCILKEYNPHDTDNYEKGKKRFIDSAKLQNKIRQKSVLNNQTPPVSHIFELNGTVYIDVVCYNGTSLDKIVGLDLPQYMALCKTIAKTVGYYHKSGYLCLDIKPENIFILQNAPDDTITQIVEFIDFDSIYDMNNGNKTLFSYTKEWAAPEQTNPYYIANIGETTDIYTVGEIVFYILFGRHSKEKEHRSFSEYPFSECRKEYRKFTERPDIQRLFSKFFRGTIRSSVFNRFKNIDKAIEILGEIIEQLNRKDYIIPILPSVSPDFVGRDNEIRQISANLHNNHVLYITGIGGIGKSTLVRNYISKYRTEYEVIVYLEYDGDIQHTFCDDMQLQISTVSRQDGEPLIEYFNRKLKAFRRICFGKSVLFVVDNFNGMQNKSFRQIIECGYDTIIVTRNKPPKNSFSYIEVGAINDTAEILRLISSNLGRSLTKEESIYFNEIILLVQGHTLVIELIARQISAGRLDVHTALDLIHETGFSRFSDEKIGNYKDGEEIYDTLSAVISALFNSNSVDDNSRLTLKILALLNVRGLEKSLVQKFFPDIQIETVSKLSAEGWLYDDVRIRLHPVIAETVRNWLWCIDDVTVMEYHKKMIDIYVGMANDIQIKEILREAEIFSQQHPRHIIKGIYYDMLGDYYDTLSEGKYIPYTKEEADILQNMLDSMEMAIEEMELSTDIRSREYLIQYYLSLASIIIRSYPESSDEAVCLLEKVQEMIEENSDNHCYYCMIWAWYYTLIEPDIDKTKSLTEQAEYIARQVFPTDLEIIDIIYIPTANCFYYHNKFSYSAHKIEEAVEICRKYPDIIPYIDKLAELLNILLDIYIEMNDKEKCRELIADIEYINETYKEQGVCREVSPEIRERAGL